MVGRALDGRLDTEGARVMLVGALAHVAQRRPPAAAGRVSTAA